MRSSFGERQERRAGTDGTGGGDGLVVRGTAPSAPAPEHGADARANEREAAAAVRALGPCARHRGYTAAEVAVHSGQPDGSVSGALRALVTRRLVARTETARGIEYSLTSPGDVKPFKRAKGTPKAPLELATPSAPALAGEAPGQSVTAEESSAPSDAPARWCELDPAP